MESFYIGQTNTYVASLINISQQQYKSGHLPLPNSAAVRDSFHVSRALNTDTDCHGFADRTFIDSFTDAGTYGSFDAVVTMNASGAANHMHGFQERHNYGGTGTLDQIVGFWSFPNHTGTGTLSSRTGVYVGALNFTGTGNFLEQTGIVIQNLAAADANSAIVSYQNNGHTVYAPEQGQWYCGGNMGVGGIAPSNIPFTVSNRLYGIGGKAGFIDATTTGLQLGVVGVDPSSIELVSSGGIRLQIKSATSAVTAGNNNSQSLGDATTLWTEVYAASNTINQSDRRVKEQIEDVPDLVIKAWSEVKTKRFKYIAAVDKKGDKARWHIGKIAQDIIIAFKKYGLDATEYAVLCYDKWDEQIIEHTATYETREVEKVINEKEVVDSEGVILQHATTHTVKEIETYEVKPAWTEIVPAGDRYGVRYEQAALLDIEVIKASLL